jgi:hypothetical protein
MISQKTGLASTAFLALSLMTVTVAAQDFEDVKSNGNLQLRGYGSFFMTGVPKVGGTTNGHVMIDQMHVQFMLPQAQKGKKHASIGIVHGCCLSTKSWQTTPDGRMGWDEYFVRQGFDTYMIDQVGRARSGFDASSYNNVRSGATPCVAPFPCAAQPNILWANDQSAWNVFRWGVTPCTASPCYATTVPHPDLKFPIQTIGVGPGANLQFFNQIIPDLSATLTPSPADPAGYYNSPSQMAKLATKVDGMILMGHSQSSSFPTRAALQPGSGCYPWTTAEACKVKGIIQLETGCFGNLTAAEVNTLKHIPILVVDGDYFTTPTPPASCVAMMNAINGEGGDMQYAHLPEMTPGSIYPGSPGPMPGIEHMMMIGTKNIEVADFVIGWIKSRGI